MWSTSSRAERVVVQVAPVKRAMAATAASEPAGHGLGQCLAAAGPRSERPALAAALPAPATARPATGACQARGRCSAPGSLARHPSGRGRGRRANRPAAGGRVCRTTVTRRCGPVLATAHDCFSSCVSGRLCRPRPASAGLLRSAGLRPTPAVVGDRCVVVARPGLGRAGAGAGQAGEGDTAQFGNELHAG